MVEMLAGKRNANGFGRSLILSSVVLVALFAVVLSSSGPSVAGVGPKNVWGYVFDYEGDPIPNIQVTVNIKYDGGDIRATLTDTTGPGDGSPTGFYTVTFANSLWDIGDFIEVIVSYSGDQEIVTQDIVGEGSQQVDVQFEYVIPQFGSAIGFAVAAGLIAVVALVALRRKKE